MPLDYLSTNVLKLAAGSTDIFSNKTNSLANVCAASILDTFCRKYFDNDLS